jgi:hypothetical protein
VQKRKVCRDAGKILRLAVRHQLSAGAFLPGCTLLAKPKQAHPEYRPRAPGAYWGRKCCLSPQEDAMHIKGDFAQEGCPLEISIGALDQTGTFTENS